MVILKSDANAYIKIINRYSSKSLISKEAKIAINEIEMAPKNNIINELEIIKDFSMLLFAMYFMQTEFKPSDEITRTTPNMLSINE